MPVNTSSESHPHLDLNPQGLHCQGVQGLLDCAHHRPQTPSHNPQLGACHMWPNQQHWHDPGTCWKGKTPSCAPRPSETQGRAPTQEILRPPRIGESPAQ